MKFGQGATTRDPRTPFGLALRILRERARLSQSRLAEAAGFDHSYVSRLESGTRAPTREATLFLAEALRLSLEDRDYLLASAGYLPDDSISAYADPVIANMIRALNDETIPAPARETVRTVVALLTESLETNLADRKEYVSRHAYDHQRVLANGSRPAANPSGHDSGQYERAAAGHARAR